MPWPTNPVEQYFGRGGWGWDGTQWRKLGLVWGYEDRYLIEQSDVSDVAGSYTINLPAVPAGEVWRVGGLGLYRTAVAASFARVQVVPSGAAVTIEDVGMASAGRCYNNSRELILKTGDNVRVVYVAATIGETVITTAWGYKMAVT